MKLIISPFAEAHMQAIDAWWRANRPSAPDLFLEDLAAAFDALLVAPLSGKAVRVRGAPGARRLVLRTARYHVFYGVERDTVTILAIWSAVRGRGPTPAELRGGAPRRRKR